MISPGLGFRTYLGFGEEAIWGTRVPASRYIELVAGGDGLSFDQPELFSGSIYGIGHRIDKDVAKGGRVVGGDIGFEMPYEGTEFLLKHALGAVTTTQIGTTPARTHVFTVADILPRGLSFEVNRDITAFFVEGGKINTMAFEIGLDGFLKTTANIAGEDFTRGVKTVETLPTLPPFNFAQGVLRFGVRGTEAVVNVSAAAINLNNNLAIDRRHIGSNLIAEPVRAGKVEVTYSFDAEFESTALFDDFVAATRRSLLLTFTGPPVIGAPASNYTLTLACNVGRLTKAVPLATDEGLILYTVAGRAYRDAVDRELRITMVNGVVSV
ncbi:MAG: hypothetical protein DDT42_00441 [candidate division WS2 bacterium]|uniref:Uncharacterized protein n=1 Tax=Psychracetigena formicireducens TaxID=2986056 RepID=A0A9E2F0P7_PSYF1|nr:hypothetical protein [Candidatus Psychracetigena formicireducens]